MRGHVNHGVEKDVETKDQVETGREEAFDPEMDEIDVEVEVGFNWILLLVLIDIIIWDASDIHLFYLCQLYV